MKLLTANLILLQILTMLLPLHAFAAGVVTKTPTNIQAADETVLRAFISATATTITLEPVVKYVNAVKTNGCVNTGSGFAVISDAGRGEFISFGTNSCNSTTNVTTLTNVRRGLNPTVGGFASGTGMVFDAGSKFRVTDWPVFYNNAVYKDIPVYTQGSGAYLCGSTTQPCIFPGEYTTAQVNAFTFGTTTNDKFHILYDNTIGAGRYYNPATNAYENLGGSGSVVNATTTTAGKVEVATQANLSGSALTDNSGAPLAITRETIMRGSSGAINNRNKVLASDNSGFASGSLLGSGIPTSARVLYGDRRWGAIAASGSNLGGTTCITGDTAFSSTTYAVPDSGLAQTLSPNVGSLIMMKVTYGMLRNESGNVNRIFNFQLGNGYARSNASGTYLEYQDGTVNHLKPVEHSWWMTSATGASMTVQPVIKVSTAGSFTIDGPSCFQTIIIK